MDRFLYEKSVSYKGNLIIPFIFSRIENQSIYSYTLLSEQGYKSQLHQSENPAGLYSNRLDDIINIAKKHLDENLANFSSIDYFKDRYTYKNNLIIVHQEAQKAFYDHYPPKKLTNIAAPKIFTTANDCINWVKAGLDRN
ncbi:MAG: hypothetical protein F6K10_38875 [Moorea sp. SIO2B7]|nr:hypothetical protein [Moorena sp. SIO2B7]